jgi:hypothetical protein
MPTPVPPAGGSYVSYAGLPSNWETSATTNLSFDATVAIVDEYYGPTEADNFEAWYSAALAKDKSLTPDAAVGTYLTGSATAGALSDILTPTISSLLQIPGAAAKGAAGPSLSLSNPLSFLEPLANLANALTQSNTWLRVGEVLAGGMLVYLGLKSAFQNTAVGHGARQATSTVKKSHSTAKKTAKGILDILPK